MIMRGGVRVERRRVLGGCRVIIRALMASARDEASKACPPPVLWYVYQILLIIALKRCWLTHIQPEVSRKCACINYKRNWLQLLLIAWLDPLIRSLPLGAIPSPPIEREHHRDC